MTSRRVVPSEKTALDKDDVDMTGWGSDDSDERPKGPPPALPVVVAPVVRIPRAVISKLLAYTTAMIVAPLSAYYLSLNYIYNGNSTFAGGTAAVVANVVLIAYVIAALKEDDADCYEKKLI